MGTFAVSDPNRSLALPGGTERLIAFLALQRRWVSRTKTAGVLWPDSCEDRALGSLRSALWRVRQCAIDLVDVEASRLILGKNVSVDTEELTDRSHRLIDGARIDMETVDPRSFGTELLPDWYEDWVIFERERMRQLGLSALEALSRRQLAAGHFVASMESALTAISIEPLRETANRALIEVHFAEGNVSEALRRFRVYADMLKSELGICPSDQLVRRVDELMRLRRPRSGRDWERPYFRSPHVTGFGVVTEHGQPLPYDIQNTLG